MAARAVLLALLLCAASARGDEITLEISGGAIVLDLDAGVDRPAIEDWVRRAAKAVATFYGRFPVARVRLEVARAPGDEIHGTTYGGRLVKLRVGKGVTADDLARDWTLTHEMFHLAFPDVYRGHTWMQEGMATYFEPLARVRVGDLAPEKVWADLFAGLPKGLPKDGDRGLDRTPTWGRTYWGGALFWFIADLEIREATGNRRSADDALRGILDAGGDGEADWSMAKILAVGDRATGTHVLVTLYERMADHPYPVDVAALKKRLAPFRASMISGSPPRPR